MNPSLEQITRLLATISPNIRATLIDHQPGQPRAQAYDSDRTTSGQGPSDPTYQAAVTPNQAKADLARYDASIVRAYTALLAIAAMQEKYCPPHEPRRGAILNETRGCELHLRAGLHANTYVRTDFGSVLPQPLKVPVAVCSACYDYTRGAGETPSNEQLHHHDRTGKWKRRNGGRGKAA